MRLDALSKSISFYGMNSIFKIIPSKIVTVLEDKLDVLFRAQSQVKSKSNILATDPSNTVFISDLQASVVARQPALFELEYVSLEPTNLLTNYKGIDEEEVRKSNRYYSQYDLSTELRTSHG